MRGSVAERATALATANDVASLIALDVPLVERERQAYLVREAVAAGRCYATHADGRAVAYLTWDDGFFGRPFVRLLVVDVAYRRQGIACELLCAAEAAAMLYGELFVSTETENLRMRALLPRRGYESSGTIENVNEPGNAELVFYKRLAATRRYVAVTESSRA